MQGRLKGAVSLAVVIVVLLALGGVANRLLVSHRDFGVWTLRVHSPTPRVEFRNRRYDRLAVTPTLAGRSQVGTTPDGHPVFAAAAAPTPPPLLVVQLTTGAVGYRLVN